jgi:type IV pilus biogenesis protein CpaD/CtpE
MQHQRRIFGVVVLVAALAATAAACGDNDDDTNAVNTEARAPSAVDVAGSDQRLNNQAEELTRQERVKAATLAGLAEQYERQAHLEGQARIYGGDVPNPVEAGNRAAAEEAERQAHLDGQANTYGD